VTGCPLAIAADSAAVGFAFSTGSPSTLVVPLDEGDEELEFPFPPFLPTKLQARTTETSAKSANSFFICRTRFLSFQKSQAFYVSPSVDVNFLFQSVEPFATLRVAWYSFHVPFQIQQ
jgi:hypothetical protein